MLTINTTAPRPSINDTGAPPAHGDPAGFASLLRQTQAAPAPAPASAPAAPPAPPAPAEPGPSAAAATPAPDPAAPAEAQAAQAPQEPPQAHEPPPADPTRPTRALLKNALPAGDTAGPTRRSAPPGDPATTAAPRDADAADTRTDAPATPPAAAEPMLDPSVLHWLAALQHPLAAPDATGRSAATAAPADATSEPAPDTAHGGAARVRSSAPGAAELKADADAKDAAAPSRTTLADASGADRFALALAEHGPREKAAAPPSSPAAGARDATALNAAALAAAPRGLADIAAPVAVAVATPLGAPDFAQALGLTLSVLARDGVQQAELHLNPAEMGPVSVQIVLDGTQARIDFGADIVATRQAIEAGLPELASALRDAGFTLAGGGVSQHASGHGNRGDGGNPADAQGVPGRRRNIGADAVHSVATAARRIVRAGGVDLFA